MLIQRILTFITDQSELKSCMDNVDDHFAQVFMKCYAVAVSKCNIEITAEYLIEIDTVVDFLQDELNTGHWSEVPLFLRHAFTAANFVKALIVLKCNDITCNVIKEALKCIDIGLLMGAPLENNEKLLNLSAAWLTKELQNLQTPENMHVQDSLKRKLYDYCHIYEKQCGKEIDELDCPCIVDFNKQYFMNQVPVKLKNCISHWPAMTKWADISYLLKVAGDRTIPVEIGSHYADEDWSQKLMTMSEFIKEYYLKETSTNNKGYLAQHNLFDQISDLRNDICIPDYCCLSRDYSENYGDPDINAWFGPEGTVSPLHHDLKDNLLAQVYGTKQILLFSPRDSPYLYPHEDKLLNNTSRVDVINPNLKEFPEFPKAAMFKCLLNPSEILYIPPKWWHHVTSLSKSFSVSFWWK